MRKAKLKPVVARVKSGVESIHTIDEAHFKRAVVIDHYYRPDHFTIMFLEKGELHSNYNREDVIVTGPAVMFTVPDSQFILKGRTESISMISLFYTPDYAAETGMHLTGSAARKFLLHGQAPHAGLNDCEVVVVQNLMKVLHKIINEPCSHEYNHVIIKHCFSALMFEVGAVLTKNIPVKEVRISRKERLTAEFLELLSLHFYQQRNVSFYADKLNVTARHLSHTTKAVFHKTAGEMIDEAVVNEAKNLLKNPQYNISQIADALNFSNPSFFGKFFKKHTGKSPSEFRIALV